MIWWDQSTHVFGTVAANPNTIDARVILAPPSAGNTNIYLISGSRTTNGIGFGGDNTILITMPGTTLRWAGGTGAVVQDCGEGGFTQTCMIRLYQVNGNWLEVALDLFPASGASTVDHGIYIRTATNAGAARLNTVRSSRIEYITGANAGTANGIRTATINTFANQNITHNRFHNIAIDNMGGGTGISVNYSGAVARYNMFSNISINGGAPANLNSIGIAQNLSYNNVHSVKISNVYQGIFTVSSTITGRDSVFANVLVASTGSACLTAPLNSSTLVRSMYHGITVVGCGTSGYYEGSAGLVLNNFAAINNTSYGINVANSGTPNIGQDDRYRNIALLNNGVNPMTLTTRGGTSTKFWGNILTNGSCGGTALNANCTSLTATADMTGVTTNTNNTNITNTYLGKVTSDDSSNSSDSNGSGTYAAFGFDWGNFSSWYRAWMPDAADMLNAAVQVGCSSVKSTCNIYDARVKSSDSVLKNINGTFVAGSPCPASVHGTNLAVTDPTVDALIDPDEKTYLLNAIEIFGEGVGNDNGLCNSNEDCIFMPNIGAYQGEGDYLSQGTCTFTGGTVSGVRMYGYPTNGG